MSHPDPTKEYGENEKPDLWKVPGKAAPVALKKRSMASKVFAALKRPPEGKSLRRHQQKYWKQRSNNKPKT